ncbi:hypothetical protein DM02DRAFT_680898 [Periconia macrospinosa]|uniref:Chromodomain-helicase-DNA-binding protein 1-like C-terminal domain-containing protein n=1 Tax=Periconia macrospinosa TaxID=97972 RepID=A0A2V1DL79_9PLEO|nr:hypothetical protein DM02DRAFT_680898 [Periconia macrospinosa]
MTHSKAKTIRCTFKRTTPSYAKKSPGKQTGKREPPPPPEQPQKARTTRCPPPRKAAPPPPTALSPENKTNKARLDSTDKEAIETDFARQPNTPPSSPNASAEAQDITTRSLNLHIPIHLTIPITIRIYIPSTIDMPFEVKDKVGRPSAAAEGDMSSDPATTTTKPEKVVNIPTSPKQQPDEADADVEVQMNIMKDVNVQMVVEDAPTSSQQPAAAATEGGIKIGAAPWNTISDCEMMDLNTFSAPTVGKKEIQRETNAIADEILERYAPTLARTESEVTELPKWTISAPTGYRPQIRIESDLDEESKAILRPVQGHLEKLGGPLPPQGLRIKTKLPMQIMKERLIPIGEHIMSHLKSVPVLKRGRVEIQLCQYIANHFWPDLPNAPNVSPHLYIMEIYRNALMKRSLPAPVITYPAWERAMMAQNSTAVNHDFQRTGSLPLSLENGPPSRRGGYTRILTKVSDTIKRAWTSSPFTTTTTKNNTINSSLNSNSNTLQPQHATHPACHNMNGATPHLCKPHTEKPTLPPSSSRVTVTQVSVERPLRMVKLDADRPPHQQQQKGKEKGKGRVVADKVCRTFFGKEKITVHAGDDVLGRRVDENGMAIQTTDEEGEREEVRSMKRMKMVTTTKTASVVAGGLLKWGVGWRRKGEDERRRAGKGRGERILLMEEEEDEVGSEGEVEGGTWVGGALVGDGEGEGGEDGRGEEDGREEVGGNGNESVGMAM